MLLTVLFRLKVSHTAATLQCTILRKGIAYRQLLCRLEGVQREVLLCSARGYFESFEANCIFLLWSFQHRSSGPCQYYRRRVGSEMPGHYVGAYQVDA